MNFKFVAEIFDKIEKESSRTAITQLLADLLKKCTPSEAASVAYISLGELNPPYIGTQFNFAEKSMIAAISKLLDVTEKNIASQAKERGDLGIVIELNHNKKDSSLTIRDVNKVLHEIHDISGTGSQEGKEKALLALFKDLDFLSAKFVVRIILGKLRLGFSDMTLLDAFSWMEVGDKSLRDPLEDAYNVTADIGYIIKTLKEDGIKGIEKIQIVPGIPIRPAAAERLESAAAIFKKLGKCVAQAKLDGFRLQVHLYKENGKKIVKFFSRNLVDMSQMFPELTEAVLSLNVEVMVAEGEAISYDQETDTFLPFQETVKRKRKYDIEQVAQDFPLRLYLFDLLYLNGKSFLGHTHEERREGLLKFHVKDPKQAIYVIGEEWVHSAQELENYFYNNVSAGLEGIVVKRPDASYRPGKRNFNWIKLKREEEGHLEDTLDCVILGYYAGHGKRASFGIGAFLVGIYDPKEDMFKTVAKIGTGLKDEEWVDLRKMCDKIIVRDKPKNVNCAPALHCDEWVNPEVVCAIRADEITISPLHSAGYALRFPRIMSFRPDKSATDATTLKEVKELYELQKK